ncbi:TadE-like family protein 2 [Achromobacter xylosoxidans A8]|uniref:TadE-like family protein 2 n=1 Tax=Achromobacter xylosoxidans (strain A8) TaxID=762376 RepID=E3HIV6_ACHXA|nr:pilus assembly protein TadE [Achromobacter xylosoxidans]ADP15527.1 TadE-like family protein 2 [Achromobacter xylosoxidans A8]
MNRIRTRQQGQALIEALLMLPLLALLLWAASWIGGLQFTAQEVAQASRKAAMAGALGQPSQNQHAPSGTALSRNASALPGIAPAQVTALQDEWFGAELKLMTATASTARRDRDNAAWLRIARRTHVASGAGYAHGDTDAQRRIGRAPTSWRRAESASLAEARRLKPVVDRLDGPWRRPGLSLDWLSEWADVVPADRLSNRKGAGK